jgi:hypothetical protein
LITAELTEAPLVRCEVVVAGSTAQCTDVEGGKDLDLLVRFANFDPGNVGVFTEFVDKMLTKSGLEISNMKRDSTRLLEFELNGVNVDLLVGGSMTDRWPRCIIELEPRLRGHMRPTYTTKTEEFLDQVSKSHPFCRDVVRVAKRWRDHEIQRWENGVRPTSFLITLLVVTALLSSQTFPNDPSAAIEAGFLAFLDVLVKYKELCEPWMHAGWFQKSDVPDEVKVRRPLLLDPADPTNNVATSVKKWDQLALTAASSMEKERAKWAPTRGRSADLD